MGANKQIRDKTINYNVYRDGTKFLGTSTIDLPEFAPVSDALKGAGILGEVEMPVIGQIGSTSVTLNWNAIALEGIELMTTKRISLDLRSAQQIFDPNSGGLSPEAVRISIRGMTKTNNLGSLEPGTAAGGSTEIELHYIKILIGGKEVLEIDKFNSIYRVNGVDEYAEVRAALGE